MDYNQYMQGVMPPRARKDLPQDMQDRLNKIPWTQNPSRSFFNAQPIGNMPWPNKVGGTLPEGLSGMDYFSIIDFNKQNNRKMRSMRNQDGTYTLENGLKVSQQIMDYLGWFGAVDTQMSWA